MVRWLLCGGLHGDSVFVGTLVLTTAVYMLINLFYSFMDLTGRPAFLYKYKIQGDQHVWLHYTV